MEGRRGRWQTPYEFGFIYPDDVTAVNDINRRMNAGVDARSISYNRNRDKNGAVHYCEWYNSALLDEHGELTSIFSIVLDFTDRHEAQQALRAREEFLRLAYEASGTWLWEVNLRTEVVRWHEPSPVVYSSSERLRLAFDAAYLGAWDWNIKTGEVKWDGHHEAMFGFAPRAFDGRYETFLNAIHPEDRASAVSNLQRSMNEKRGVSNRVQGGVA